MTMTMTMMMTMTMRMRRRRRRRKIVVGTRITESRCIYVRIVVSWFCVSEMRWSERPESLSRAREQQGLLGKGRKESWSTGLATETTGISGSIGTFLLYNLVGAARGCQPATAAVYVHEEVLKKLLACVSVSVCATTECSEAERENLRSCRCLHSEGYYDTIRRYVPPCCQRIMIRRVALPLSPASFASLPLSRATSIATSLTPARQADGVLALSGVRR
jgi:hypothetical protein